MKCYEDISVQKISWIKSNKRILEAVNGIRHLYYPESMAELTDLIREMDNNHCQYIVIGQSSNTLFLPSFNIDTVVCTTNLKHWEERETHIVCDCGVNVSLLAKSMVEKGYVGFEGLTDLPGTIAAAVYGNCGCRSCSVNELVDFFTMLMPSGEIRRVTPSELHLAYRSTALKRGEMQGVILQIYLKIQKGDAEELRRKAFENHRFRQKTQPSAANNLGTTFILGRANLTGRIYNFAGRILRCFIRNEVKVFACLLYLSGKGRFAQYTWRIERYMFLDERAHRLFPEYVQFVNRLYPEAQLEIEIRGEQ